MSFELGDNMNAEQVVGKILADAGAEANEISSQGQQELAKEQKTFDAELEAYRKQSQKLAADAAEDKKLRMMATARMAAAKGKLTAKISVMDEVFAKAGDDVVKLDDKQYCELMSSIMCKIVETGDEKVVVGKNETRIDDEFVKQINRKLGNGFKGNLRLASDKCDAQNGFVLKRGSVSTNATVEVLLRQAKEILETEISSELFGSDVKN